MIRRKTEVARPTAEERKEAVQSDRGITLSQISKIRRMGNENEITQQEYARRIVASHIVPSHRGVSLGDLSRAKRMLERGGSRNG